MIKQALNFLFFRMYKKALVNFGQDAGFAATLTISALFAFNILSLIGFFNKILFHNPKMSAEIFVIVFFIALILCYFLFFYKAKNKQIILYYENRNEKGMIGTLCVIGYIFISFLLFVIVALIRV
jgi:hypothetical protein